MFMVLTFLWIQNKNCGQPILSMLRVCTREFSGGYNFGKITFPWNFFFSPEKIASGNLISLFIKTSITKFCYWFAVNICRWFSCHASGEICQWIIMVFDTLLYFKKWLWDYLFQERVSLKCVGVASVHIEDTQLVNFFLTFNCVFLILHWLF